MGVLVSLPCTCRFASWSCSFLGLRCTPYFTTHSFAPSPSAEKPHTSFDFPARQICGDPLAEQQWNQKLQGPIHGSRFQSCNPDICKIPSVELLRFHRTDPYDPWHFGVYCSVFGVSRTVPLFSSGALALPPPTLAYSIAPQPFDLPQLWPAVIVRGER